MGRHGRYCGDAPCQLMPRVQRHFLERQPAKHRQNHRVAVLVIARRDGAKRFMHERIAVRLRWRYILRYGINRLQRRQRTNRIQAAQSIDDLVIVCQQYDVADLTAYRYPNPPFRRYQAYRTADDSRYRCMPRRQKPRLPRHRLYRLSRKIFKPVFVHVDNHLKIISNAPRGRAARGAFLP